MKKEEKQLRPLIWDIVFLLLKIGGIALIFVLLFTFLFGIYRNQGTAMDPAVKDGDLVLFYRLDREYQASDVVVLRAGDEKQVRRVAAVAGDTVDITEEGLVINGFLQQEAGIYEQTWRYEGGVEFPLTVPEGQIFVLGDSRENSTDSRIYGTVKTEDTLGTVMTVIRRRGI